MTKYYQFDRTTDKINSKISRSAIEPIDRLSGGVSGELGARRQRPGAQAGAALRAGDAHHHQRRDHSNPALAELLAELRHLAAAANEEEEERAGLVLHTRHTARAVARKLTSCSPAAPKSHVDATATAAGKRLPCYSLPCVHHDDGGDDDDDIVVGSPANRRRSLRGIWSSKEQQRKPVVSAPKLKFDRVEMSDKMIDIIEQLKPLCAKVATILGLESLGYSSSAKTQHFDLEHRPRTNPEIIEPELYGRESQKQKVVDEIINEYCANDLTVLPIVGPGGIGKTTFTQHIYDKVKNHFQVRVWFLLVLDDMWTYHEDEWNTFLSPFRRGGTKGNMVIVTTRIPKVAQMVQLMSCSKKLDRLQDEDSMQLFQACVGTKTWESYPGLKDVGENIVKRLKGFPLAIKTVGRLLRNQHNLDRWTTVLKKCHGSFYKIFGDILRDAKSLRVIFLSGASYNVEDLLYNFAKLVHLRYLRIEDSYIPGTILPSNMNRFYHLLVLDVHYHSGELGFLSNMRNLLKLRHFLVWDDSFHSCIFEVGKLKLLKELRRFVVKREEKGFDLDKIGHFLELHGSLGIYNLRMAKEIKEADEAKLVQFNRLGGLKLDWGAEQCENPIQEQNILESLKPHNNLRGLHIAGHGGATYPNWLGADFSIRNLESLILQGVNWGILPLPGKLCMYGCEELKCSVHGQGFDSLRMLKLVEIPKLKKWCGISSCILLPHLQNLYVCGCPNLIELPFSDATSNQSKQSMTYFPELQNIDISNCPKLLSFPPIPWSHSLFYVSIEGVGSEFYWLWYDKDKQLRIKGKDDGDGSFWDLLDLNKLMELPRLEIKNCPPISVDHIKMLTCLEILSIEGPSNTLLALGSEKDARYKLSVKKLTIDSRGASGSELTQWLSHFPKLSYLKISNCPNVTELAVEEQKTMAAANKTVGTVIAGHQQETEACEEEVTAAAGDQGLLLLPPQIQQLTIRGCRELSFRSNSTAPLVDRGGLQGLASLQSLTIFECPMLLRVFPFPDLWCGGHGDPATASSPKPHRPEPSWDWDQSQSQSQSQVVERLYTDGVRNKGIADYKSIYKGKI
uniref:NB-ARC domain-containing protein n=1 Tax=Oryza brachyantha TaxID=4533 RepID=J3NDF9_ORYBR